MDAIVMYELQYELNALSITRLLLFFLLRKTVKIEKNTVVLTIMFFKKINYFPKVFSKLYQRVENLTVFLHGTRGFIGMG